MELSTADLALIQALQAGLPLTRRPYAAIGESLGLTETAVLARLEQMMAAGVIKRFGVVVRHRALGYRANAMVVWDIPDNEVAELGHCLGRYAFVTLSYRRPRRPPHWPYNLFTMIHGQDRDAVREKLEMIVHQCDLQTVSHQVLFSTRCFRQRGACYNHTPPAWPLPPAADPPGGLVSIQHPV
ncbi:MAG: AsnC family transcriptional regulator [Pseudomonadota bacterium]